MPKDKTNVLDILLMCFMLLLFGGLATAGWLTGSLPQALITTGIALLILYALVGALRKGVRPPDPYERFKAWMSLRPLLIGVAGIGLLLIATQTIFPATRDAPQEAKAGLLIIPVLIWVVAIFYTIWRAPRRYETDAAYRRRVGYKPRE